jgi:hypothetical protein
MKVEFIITFESDEHLPDGDDCDQIADRLQNELSALTADIAHDSGVDSRWRKTL